MAICDPKLGMQIIPVESATMWRGHGIGVLKEQVNDTWFWVEFEDGFGRYIPSHLMDTLKYDEDLSLDEFHALL